MTWFEQMPRNLNPSSCSNHERQLQLQSILCLCLLESHFDFRRACNCWIIVQTSNQRVWECFLFFFLVQFRTLMNRRSTLPRSDGGSNQIRLHSSQLVWFTISAHSAIPHGLTVRVRAPSDIHIALQIINKGKKWT